MSTPPRDAALAIALDLGSTRVKAAGLGTDGRLGEIVAEAAPVLRGEGTIREGDADAWRIVAARVLARAREGRPVETPIGIASQRSSFLLWDRESGEPATPFVSWQDRRAEDWCRRHRGIAATFPPRTGLLLSPHYVGPKLAAMMEQDDSLRRRVTAGELRLGTLETWLLWNWTGGDLHRTDPTMAARTLLFDPDAGDWADDLLDLFGVPRAALARVEPSVGRPVSRPGLGTLAATLADQASGLLAAVGDETDVALVNFGTGCFVLRPTGTQRPGRPGYLAGPILAPADGPARFAVEGTINGGGGVVDRFGPGPTELPERDPSPRGFCLPDSAGVGAPHWRAETSFVLSEAAAARPDPEKRRVVLEGLIFRVREILAGLFPAAPPRAVFLSGGLSREPFVAAGLAAALERDVTLLDQREGTLLGVARLAAGRSRPAEGVRRVISPGRRGAYLAGKFRRWSEWLSEVLAASGGR